MTDSVFSFKRQTFDELPFTFRPGWNLVLMTRLFLLVAKISFGFGFFLFFLNYFLPSYTGKVASVLFIVSTCFCLFFLFCALFIRVIGGGKKKQRFYRVDTAEVVCIDGHGTRLWQEPIHAYKGIRWCEEMHVVPGPGVGSNIANRKELQALYLVHSSVSLLGRRV